MAMAASLLFLLLAVAATAVHGVKHNVGGTNGWSQSADYATWASGETFTVGDTLLFSYSGSLHGVDIVSKSDYDNCNSGNALKTFTDGQTTISLSKTGPMYFICPTSGHCSSGMKLAINVVAATTPSGTPSVISPPSDSTPASDGSSGTPTTSTTNSSPKSDNSGAEGHFGHFSRGVLRYSLVVAGLVVLMS